MKYYSVIFEITKQNLYRVTKQNTYFWDAYNGAKHSSFMQKKQ